MKLQLLIVFVALVFVQAENQREGKVFSLFSVVTFRNEPCQSTSSLSGSTGSQYHNGTCFTSNECQDKGGHSNGNCASGFGVCCVFFEDECGKTVRQNNTYLRNPGYPNSYSEKSPCEYKVEKVDAGKEVCFLRLDFETFKILGPVASDELDGGNCQDTFSVTSSDTSANQIVPTVCGSNAGQHMYIDMGKDNDDSAAFTFTFGDVSSSNGRQWEIKVAQIPCFSNYRPPVGCLQYHTGTTGRIETFNFGDAGSSHLANQQYSACVRQEEGFCCVQYSVCSDANSFSLDTEDTAAMVSADHDTACTTAAYTKDSITIPGSSSVCYGRNTANRYCGSILSSSTLAAAAVGMYTDSTICDCSSPFSVGIYTNSLTDVGDSATPVLSPSRGVCLEYKQIAC